MNNLISILVVVLSTIVSIFFLSNILLSIFYTIPRIIKEKSQNNLLNKIPLTKILIAPLTFSIILVLLAYLIYNYLPKYHIEELIGFGFALLIHVTRIGKKNSDMDEDFKRYFKDYLKSSNLKSDYYTSQNELKPLIKRAFEKYTINDYKSAIAIYDKILDLNPLLASALSMRAQCLERLNFNLDAIDDYEAAISINDSDGNVFGLLGLLYSKIGNLEKTQFYLEQAVEKGYKQYDYNLQMLTFLSDDEMKQSVIDKCNIPKNLIRRNIKDFDDDLSEIDRKEFNDKLIKSISGLKTSMALDPENEELKKLHDSFYSKLN